MLHRLGTNLASTTCCPFDLGQIAYLFCASASSPEQQVHIRKSCTAVPFTQDLPHRAQGLTSDEQAGSVGPGLGGELGSSFHRWGNFTDESRRQQRCVPGPTVTSRVNSCGPGQPQPRAAIYPEVCISLPSYSLQFYSYHIESFSSPGEETTKMITLL